ncbi:heparinase II/III family protein [Brachybacterium sp. YJGR34]|uniref:heparinase II/III family protein n=1 Tax=Brachybacterium sp. YJGR34 TaxID=2059911 RepID=UPI0013006FDF|nr:heparinase II/III family protein [Brachybacterium sp. YJGR34]
MIAGALAHRGPGSAPSLDVHAGLGRALGALGDPDWAAARPGPAPLPASTWLPEVELWVARERAGSSRGLALAAKGGHNAESHNHLDVGSVMVALDASPVLIDLGQPTYLAHTFTERRYEIWTMVSSWHTLPTVAGHEQGVGEQYRAQVLAAPGDRESEVVLELAGAYPAEAGLRSWRRRTELERASGGDGAAVRIEDRWQLAPGSASDAVRSHHVLSGEVLEHAAGSLRIRALSGALAQLTWDPSLGTGELERREVDDPLLRASWGESVHRLVLTPTTAATGDGALAVSISAV